MFILAAILCDVFPKGSSFALRRTVGWTSRATFEFPLDDNNIYYMPYSVQQMFLGRLQFVRVFIIVAAVTIPDTLYEI